MQASPSVQMSSSVAQLLPLIAVARLMARAKRRKDGTLWPSAEKREGAGAEAGEDVGHVGLPKVVNVLQLRVALERLDVPPRQLHQRVDGAFSSFALMAVMASRRAALPVGSALAATSLAVRISARQRPQYAHSRNVPG
eukprot:3935675-Prymnesium_polylepis.1